MWIESMNAMIKPQDYRKLPLVYSCSGCSSAAQTANYIALKLDREGEAEMSCISGVGGNVPHLVTSPARVDLFWRLMAARSPARCIACLNVVLLPTTIYSCMNTALKNATTPISIKSKRIWSHPRLRSRRVGCVTIGLHLNGLET